MSYFINIKASQSSRPQTRKIQIIFHRDMCVGKNTSQTASVEFCRLRQNYARSRLQAFWQKKRSFFASLSPPTEPSAGGNFFFINPVIPRPVRRLVVGIRTPLAQGTKERIATAGVRTGFAMTGIFVR